PRIRAAMPALLRSHSPRREALVVAPLGLIKELFDALAQRSLISLESQHVIGSLAHDRLRNVLLAAHSVKCYRGTLEVECFEQFWNRRDFIGLLFCFPL